ncbi:MAG: hypothetical protein LUF29_07870 [Oscillospiraceae bacterium]|nr:hypothetical protein [Oscillospiraceae bacterium]
MAMVLLPLRGRLIFALPKVQAKGLGLQILILGQLKVLFEAVKASPERGGGPPAKPVVEGWNFGEAEIPQFAFGELQLSPYNS